MNRMAQFADLSDTKKVFALMLLAFVMYLPFVFLGYGTDLDSYEVARAGKILITYHKYTPSRYPGYFVHEIPSAILNFIGGATLTNLGSLVMSLCTIYFFASILNYHDVPHKCVLILILITNPIYWVNSTSTIDYIWALALMLVGYRLFLAQSFIKSGLFLGLAIGTRLSSIILLIVLLGFQCTPGWMNRKQIIVFGLIAMLIGSILYIPSYLESGFLKLYFGDWNWIDYLINFIYGNLLFWGHQTFLAILCTIYFAVRRIRQISNPQRELLLLCSCVIIGYELLFLSFPLEVAYLLPLLPFLLILIGIFLEKQKWVISLWLLLQSSFNVVSIGFIYSTSELYQPVRFTEPLLIIWPEVAGRATSMTIGLFLEWGYLISDTTNRINGTFNW